MGLWVGREQFYSFYSSFSFCINSLKFSLAHVLCQICKSLELFAHSFLSSVKWVAPTELVFTEVMYANFLACARYLLFFFIILFFPYNSLCSAHESVTWWELVPGFCEMPRAWAYILDTGPQQRQPMQSAGLVSLASPCLHCNLFMNVCGAYSWERRRDKERTRAQDISLSFLIICWARYCTINFRQLTAYFILGRRPEWKAGGKGWAQG